MDNSRVASLKQQIEAAFAEIAYPGDAQLIDDPDDWEQAELLEAFKGRHWKNLTYEELAYHSFSFLDPAGFHYYLPAYLIMALDGFRDKLQFIVHGLSWRHGDGEDARKTLHWCTERFAVLNLAQRRAVRAFLEYARDDRTKGWFSAEGREEINQAIADFWADDATLLPPARE